MNPERKHRHGSALRPPSTKDELIRHLEAAHGSKPFERTRWTRNELIETHRIWHVGLSSEGLEQA